MTVAAFVVSVFALLVAAWALVYARQQASAVTEQSRIAAEQLALAKDQAEKYRVPWHFEWRGGDTYALVNGSDEIEYDVEIHAPEHTAFQLRSVGDIVHPRSSVVFLAAFTMASPGRSMRVTWRHRPGGELFEWSDWLPRRE